MPEDPRKSEVGDRADSQARQDATAQSFFDSHPLPMWVCDKTTQRIFDANDSAIRHYGYSRAQFQSMFMADLDEPENPRRLGVSRETGQEADGRRRTRHHRRADGTIIPVTVIEGRATIEGRLIMSVTAIDATEHEQLLGECERRIRELSNSELRFRQLFEIGADYYWEMDAEYRMSYVSPNYESIVGIPAAEALESDPSTLQHIRSF